MDEGHWGQLPVRRQRLDRARRQHTPHHGLFRNRAIGSLKFLGADSIAKTPGAIRLLAAPQRG